MIRLRKGMYISQISNYHELEKKALKKGYSQAIFRIEIRRFDNKDEPIIYLITNILSTKRVGKQ